MSMIVPTKRIVAPVTEENPLGYIVINESDFDAATMQDFDAAPAKPTKGGATGATGATGDTGK